MTNNYVNLVPKQRQQASCKKERMHFWMGSCGGYALLWLIAILVIKLIGIAGPDALGADLEKINNRAKEVEADLSMIRSDLGRSSAEFAASQKIGSQPDWSVILSLLSSTLGESIVLREFQLKTDQASDSASSRGINNIFRQEKPASKQQNIDMGMVELEIGGLGLNQQSVSEYVLRLEQLDLFSQVKLVETRREPFLDSQAIAFHLQCIFNSSEASNP